MTIAALQLQNLRKQYVGVEALKGIDLTVQAGDFFGLLGPNGAGKSTTLGIISSLVRKTAGSVHIFGKNLDTEPTAAKRLLGLVPQEVNFSVFERVEDIVQTQAGFYGLSPREARENTAYFLKKLDLWDKRDVQARRLSGGMKRRLLIARGMVHRPKLLLLDEPSAGVDVELRHQTWEFLESINQQDGTTIILTTHYLEEAERLCGRIGIINQGALILNLPTQDLLAQLTTETFLLDLMQPTDRLPVIAGYDFQWLPKTQQTIEVRFSTDIGLNHLFAGLSAQGLEARSIRNKANRLETLFLDRIDAAGEI